MTGKHALYLVLAILLCLLLGTAVLAQHAAPAAPPVYLVEAGAALGPGYRLAGGTWQVEGNAGGAGYLLQAAGSGILQGAGCCCTYLPCMSRAAP